MQEQLANLQPYQQMLITYAPRVLGALLLMIVGRFVAPYTSRGVRRVLKEAGVDETFTEFSAAISYYSIWVIFLATALSWLGIGGVSITALMGTIAIAVGLALQDTLANFAAGILILISGPYRVNDYVTINGESGYVTRVEIFNTWIRTLDYRTIIVPNRQVIGNNIMNYSKNGFVRLDMEFGIGYDENLLQAKQILLDIVQTHRLILKVPAPTVDVCALADNSVNFAVRPFVRIEEYHRVRFDVTEQVKLRFDAAGIEIPYPQRTVHVVAGEAVALSPDAVQKTYELL
ncbi:MAG: mechanosensitive ion channel domain-containing protein [Chloroflexota bacterium]